MKTRNALLTMIAMASVMGGESYHNKRIYLIEEQLERKRKEAEAASNRAKGLKPFKYGETIIWALNQKNADKKATKLGLI